MQLCHCIIQGVVKAEVAGGWRAIEGKGCYMLALLYTLTRAPLLATARGRILDYAEWFYLL